ncbi:ABC transporter permease subunit [Fluviispira multicolorata]|uniref:ABC transporter permease subunit n=1 Tax=Fluviispira multicolorata TaxID=2654512 RepID=A0A833JEL1_9BACT|nr:ABC transporter permease subunit [Fluviispira multicolorata]KAB8033270.1 ABC transporter permease subunit [Fluviispira multicolorata]
MQKLPIGAWAQDGVNFLTQFFENQFRFVSDSIASIIEKFISLLMWFPPLAFIITSLILIFIVKRSIKNILVISFCFLAILNLGYWEETLETMTLVLFATLISTFVGIPIGILCAHHSFIYAIMRPVLDLMQTIPTFVYLIPTLMLFGLGMAPGLISTIIFAMPAVIRLTYLGISNVPHALLEVADSFGANSWKKLSSVEIPHAWQSIKTGISQCMMLSLSMVVVAALVGADGLGKPVVQALNTVNISKGIESGMTIVFVAILLDRIFANSSQKIGAVR